MICMYVYIYIYIYCKNHHYHSVIQHYIQVVVVEVVIAKVPFSGLVAKKWEKHSFAMTT